MNNFKYLYITLIAIGLSSCITKKELFRGISESAIDKDLSVLDGTYKNVAANSLQAQDETSLYLLLFNGFHFQNSYYNKPKDYDGFIKITAIDNNKLKVERLINDSVVETKRLKGKIEDNFFVTKRKWMIFGVPVLFGTYQESKMAIGLSKDGHLYIRKYFHHTGGVIGLGGDTNERSESIYYARTDDDEYRIYKSAIDLATNLSKENPDKYFFYKTELHSVDSYVWYYNNDSIVSYRITPNGTEQKVISSTKTDYIPEKSSVNLAIGLPVANKNILGYSKFENNNVMIYRVEVTDRYIPESERPIVLDDFKRKMNEDLCAIKQTKGLHYYKEYH